MCVCVCPCTKRVLTKTGVRNGVHHPVPSSCYLHLRRKNRRGDLRGRGSQTPHRALGRPSRVSSVGCHSRRAREKRAPPSRAFARRAEERVAPTHSPVSPPGRRRRNPQPYPITCGDKAEPKLITTMKHAISRCWHADIYWKHAPFLGLHSASQPCLAFDAKQPH